MNEAQLFIVFFSILCFGWVGFLAGRVWSDPEDKGWHLFPIVFLFLGSAGLFIVTCINLGVLLSKTLWYDENLLSRILALVIFFFYGGGVVAVWFTEGMRDFECFKREPVALTFLTIWALLAVNFGVYLWKDKGQSLWSFIVAAVGNRFWKTRLPLDLINTQQNHKAAKLISAIRSFVDIAPKI